MTLALRCRREDRPESWEWGVRLSFFWGGLGLGLRGGTKGLRIAPVLLGQFLPYPYLPLRSAKEAPAKNAAQSRAKGRAQSQQAEPALHSCAFCSSLV